jgi:hypothetical protein
MIAYYSSRLHTVLFNDCDVLPLQARPGLAKPRTQFVVRSSLPSRPVLASPIRDELSLSPPSGHMSYHNRQKRTILILIGDWQVVRSSPRPKLGSENYGIAPMQLVRAV